MPWLVTCEIPSSSLGPRRPQGTAAVARRMIGGALGIDMDKQLASLSQARGEQGERARRMVEEGEKLR